MSAWLHLNELGQYVKIFEENNIQGIEFLNLDEKILLDMKVEQIHVSRIMQFIKKIMQADQHEMDKKLE